MRYAPWWRRAAATVIDLLPLLVLTAAGAALVWFTRDRVCDTDTSAFDGGAQCGDGYSTLGYVSLAGTWLLMVGYLIWNFGYRQGRTGASLGKTVVRCRVVGQTSGAPIGFARSLLRQAVHLADLSVVGYLWPLWDARKQTFADKAMETVCVAPPPVRKPVSGTH
ncbi:MAG: RDD family protein [Mycobacterium sp.]|nr:RDD family protein [Mycobacterium sp.]